MAASFHLLSGSTAIIKTVQYPKSYQQCEIPKIPWLEYPRCCFLSPTSGSHFHNNNSLFSVVSPGLQSTQNIMSHSLQFYSIWTFAANMLSLLSEIPNFQHKTIQINLSMPQRNVKIIWCKSITLCKSITIINLEFPQNTMRHVDSGKLSTLK